MGPPFSLLKPAKRHVGHRLWPLRSSGFAFLSPSPSGEGGVQKEQSGRGVCVIVFSGRNPCWGLGLGLGPGPGAGARASYQPQQLWV